MCGVLPAQYVSILKHSFPKMATMTCPVPVDSAYSQRLWLPTISLMVQWTPLAAAVLGSMNGYSLMCTNTPTTTVLYRVIS